VFNFLMRFAAGPRVRRGLIRVAALAAAAAFWPQTGLAGLSEIRQRGVLRWGADAEGGAPYVYPDPADPKRLIGFEAEVARELARVLGVRAQQSQGNWDMLPTQLQGGEFDIILNGIEITPENAGKMALSRPYFAYGQVIVTRVDGGAWTNMAGLKGRTVGVLSGSQSQRLCKTEGRITTMVYTGNAESFSDLKTGRLDAVLVDLPIATYYLPKEPTLRITGAPFALGTYGVGVPKTDAELLKAVNEAITELAADGTLETIYRRYGVWGPEQSALAAGGETETRAEKTSVWRERRLFLPLLLRGAATTAWLTVAGMALATALGLAVSLARLYGPGVVRGAAACYIEFFRGTPLLIQLYFIYYGLALHFGLRLPKELAAVLALGLNYAANEAENFRGGILAIPAGQWEAAAALGMSRGLTLRRVILPQALRLVTPPVSNDFIAMFKDSSIVSVIAISELAKQYQTAANGSGDYLGMGVITALIYLAMSFAAAAGLRRDSFRA
jgi:polar amino acid transport system substrate-binding protein